MEKINKPQIDPYTFGGSKASETLAILLETKYPKYTNRIAKHYHHFTRKMNCLMMSHNHFYRGDLLEIMEIYKKEKFSSVKKSDMPEELKSYLMNVMSVCYKMNTNVVRKLDEI